MTDAETTDEKQARSIYITGGGTYLARHLTRTLVADGHEVAVWVNTSRQAAGVREDGGLPVFGDSDRAALVTDHLKLTKADTVLHLSPATLNVPPFVQQDWTEISAALRADTNALVDAVSRSEDVTTFIHTSFAFLYADAPEPVREDAPLRDGGSPFIDAALAAEAAAREANAIVLRAGYLFGDAPNDPLHKVQTMLQRRLMPGYFGGANAAANWCYTADFADAVLAALDAEPGAVYNIACDSALSAHGFVSSLADKLGLSLVTGMPAALAGRWRGPDYVALVNTSAAMNNDRAKAELGWQPRFADVDAALEDVLLTWRAAANA